MTYCRPHPLPAPDAPLWDRRAEQWDAFIGSIMHRSLPDSLSTPCLDCHSFAINCECVVAEDVREGDER